MKYSKTNYFENYGLVLRKHPLVRLWDVTLCWFSLMIVQVLTICIQHLYSELYQPIRNQYLHSAHSIVTPDIYQFAFRQKPRFRIYISALFHANLQSSIWCNKQVQVLSLLRIRSKMVETFIITNVSNLAFNSSMRLFDLHKKYIRISSFNNSNPDQSYRSVLGTQNDSKDTSDFKLLN